MRARPAACNPGVRSNCGGHGMARVRKLCGYLSCWSIVLRRLSGLMSVHAFLMYAKHSVLDPTVPASLQPTGLSRSAGQIEYCSS
jgi:hypothetical protein